MKLNAEIYWKLQTSLYQFIVCPCKLEHNEDKHIMKTSTGICSIKCQKTLKLTLQEAPKNHPHQTKFFTCQEFVPGLAVQTETRRNGQKDQIHTLMI